MRFELGKTYIVEVTENGIIPIEEFDESRWYDKDHDDLDFLTDEERMIVVNQLLDKIISVISEHDDWVQEELVDLLSNMKCSKCAYYAPYFKSSTSPCLNGNSSRAYVAGIAEKCFEQRKDK